MIRAGRSTPWNWGAFLGNFSWFFLRKMYARGAALGAALFAPFLLSSFAFFYTLVNLQSGNNTESAFFILVGLFFFIPLCWLVLLVACGLRANKWYYDYTQKHLNTAQSLPLEQKRQYFNKYGGVNVPLYYMGPFVIGMLVMSLFLLAFFISISPFLSQPGGIQI